MLLKNISLKIRENVRNMIVIRHNPDIILTPINLNLILCFDSFNVNLHTINMNMHDIAADIKGEENQDNTIVANY